MFSPFQIDLAEAPRQPRPAEPEAPEDYPDDQDDDLDGPVPTIREPDNPDLDLPDPVAMVRQAIAADLDSAVFADQQFETAPNVIEWCRGPQWLNYETDLFARQIQVLVRFFEDVCYFCSDVDYLFNVKFDDTPADVLDRLVLLQHGVCPHCQRNRTEMLSDWIKDPRYGKYYAWDPCVTPRPVPPNEFVGIWGQRSSKSITTSSFIWTYILHRLLALPSPTRYFRMPTNVVLQASFVSPTREQGNGNLWQPFLGSYDASPWFRRVAQYLKQESKRLGVMLYHRQQTFLIFPGKRLAVHVQAANSANLRGATRCFGTQDEMAHFNFSEDGKRRASIRNGTEVFTSLSNSLRTVRSAAEDRRRQLGDYDALDGYMVNISSPVDISDPIEQRAAIASKSFRMFFTRYPTWEVNPKEHEDLIREEFAGSPLVFSRDFGAIPPMATNPFIQDEKIVGQIVIEKPIKVLDVTIQTDQRDDGLAQLRPRLTRAQPDSSAPRCIAVDNGERSNSFALCCARYYPEQDGILIEDLVELSPTALASVDLAACYNDLVLPIAKQVKCAHVVYDRWEAGYAVADLRNNHKVDAQRYSLKWKDFDAFRQDLLGMRIFMGKPEVPWRQVLATNNLQERAQWPRAHFQAQLLTVNEFSKHLSKPLNGNDDLFRTVVLAHYFITKFREQYRHNQRLEHRHDPDRPVAMFWGNSQRRKAGQGHGGGIQQPTGYDSMAMAGGGRRGRR